MPGSCCLSTCTLFGRYRRGMRISRGDEAIKMAFSKRVAAGEARSASRRSRGERGIWQRRYWEHTIRNDQDYAIHMDYIHFNPVKHGLVTEVAAWPFSSFHKSAALGLYPPAWPAKDDATDDRGERR